MKKQELSTVSQIDESVLPIQLLEDLRTMIDQTKESIATTVNIGLTLLYWHVGSRIRSELLNNERAEYGGKIVATVSRQLAGEYGKGFSDKNLRRMIHFGEASPNEQIGFSCLCTQQKIMVSLFGSRNSFWSAVTCHPLC